MQVEVAIHQHNGGIVIRAANRTDMATARQTILAHAACLGMEQLVVATTENDGASIRFTLQHDANSQPFSGFDTLQLCEKYKLRPQHNPDDIEKEILLAMLMGPVPFEYPSSQELFSSIRIRRNIVQAARRTALAFHTSKIERPFDYWTYSEELGFTVLPGKPLIEALRKATQPDVSGEKYSFSCYRATEYVILLGIAQELAKCNPPLLQQLQRQWESRAVMSRQFHDVFLREFGSMNLPLPHKYYVPGDRLWFRNPDEASAEVTGYEGSWVFYLGEGLFSNFWQPEKPYTLTSKCIEIYHWRHGVSQDADGNPYMDESIVEARTLSTLLKPTETANILEQMMRLRDPQGVYANGGCIDATREHPVCVCPGSTQIKLPDIEYANHYTTPSLATTQA